MFSNFTKKGIISLDGEIMKNKKSRFIQILLLITIIIGILFYILFMNKNKENKMTDLSNMTLDEIREYANENTLKLNIEYEYNKNFEKDKLISQNIKKGETINKNDKLTIVISMGRISGDTLKENGVNELGNVPIMMYHGIENVESAEYIGGNVDKDGYNRTVKAFINDLEFYYKEGYRMVRLVDYIDGKINTDLGKSPIILTFDDGNKNNFNVLGKDENGNLEIDPNCAVGILESFKKKYPDYNVTATFFVMDNLFNQSEYDKEKLEWLVNNGYDVGNHTKSHVNYKTVTKEEAEYQTGYMYEKLENIIPSKYVKIIALPYGSPGAKTHENFKYVLRGNYNNKEYITEASLRVGWMPEVSPFHKEFDKTFMKRVRAYDNNGKDFDITSVFEELKTTRYISDGDIDTITIPSSKKEILGQTNLEIVEY